MRPGPAERGGGGGGGVAAAPELMAGAARPGLWRTPTPYLLLGFALMIGLIVLALLVLICTRREHSSSSTSSSSSSSSRREAASVPGVMVPLDREAPRVVVFMAGDALPSFLANAKPLAFPAPRAGAELATV